MNKKAVGKNVFSCMNENCRVLLYIPSSVNNSTSCPSCNLVGGLAVDAATRDMGQHKIPAVTDGDN